MDFETLEKAEAFKKLLAEKKIIAGLRVKVNKLTIKESNPLSKPENERQQYVNSLTKQTFQTKSLEKYSSKVCFSIATVGSFIYFLHFLVAGHQSSGQRYIIRTWRAFSKLHQLRPQIHTETSSYRRVFVGKRGDGGTNERSASFGWQRISSDPAAARRSNQKA